MANDSGLFCERGALEEGGWNLEGNVFTRGRDRMLPLYEAKMLHHYNHRFGDYSLADLVQGKGVRQLPRPELSRLDNPSFSVHPREWVDESLVRERLEAKGWSRGWLLGWRDVTSGIDERTSISAIIPKVAVGHKYMLIISSMKPFCFLV